MSDNSLSFAMPLSRRAKLWMRAGVTALAALVLGATASAPASASAYGGGEHFHRSFLQPLNTITTIASTVPANGDQNPYGTVVVKHSEGLLHRGNVLVSNFNNSANLQGTGHTLVQISPQGAVSLFAQIDPAHLPGPCPGGVGLTTALTVLPGGWVVVGSLPTADGTAATAQAGCLLVLDSFGTVRETISGNGINGPWDMTSVSHGEWSELFVTNVLNGTVAGGGAVVDQGTVLRITLRTEEDEAPQVVATTQIGSGFPERTDPAALVIGPTGVGVSREGTLYVADTLGNRIAAIENAVWRDTDAGTGRTVSTGGFLNGPLGLAISPTDTILTVNSQDGNIVETTPRGDQISVKTLDATGTPPGAGTLFGLAVDLDRDAVYFVDNGTNTLNQLS